MLHAVVNEVQNALIRIDYPVSDKRILIQILANMPTPIPVRARVISQLQKLVWASSSRDLLTIDQAEEWQQIVALVQMDSHLSGATEETSLLFAGELIWLYSMISGFGDEVASMHVWTAVRSFLQGLASVSVSPTSNELDLESMKAASARLRELQQTDVLEQLQDGYVPQVVSAIYGFISKVTKAVLSYAPTAGMN